MSERAIDVAFGIDANFAPHAAAVVAAVVRRGGPYRFIVLHSGVDATMRARVEEAAPQARFAWVEVSDDDVPPFADRSHFTRATLFRLGLETLAPADCDRIVYLDADITVLGNVAELANIDLGDAPIAGVHDPNVNAAAFAAQWALPGEPSYFNAGILLIDLARVRAEGLFTKAMRFLAEHGAALPWNDQDALNWACWRRWRALSPVWNVQRGMAIGAVERDLPSHMRLTGKPEIIHFTGAEKPWIAGAYHPWSWLYWRSLWRTSFARDVATKYGVSSLAQWLLALRFLRRWRWFMR